MKKTNLKVNFFATYNRIETTVEKDGKTTTRIFYSLQVLNIFLGLYDIKSLKLAK